MVCTLALGVKRVMSQLLEIHMPILVTRKITKKKVIKNRTTGRKRTTSKVVSQHGTRYEGRIMVTVFRA